MSEPPIVSHSYLIFYDSPSHHTRCNCAIKLNIPFHRTLTQTTQHSQQTDTMNWLRSNLLPQKANDRTPTEFCLDDLLWGESEQTWTWSLLDLYHHAQHFYSTTLSHTANCCGGYKPIWTASCFRHNTSHPLCCKFAQVVALFSPLSL